MEPNDSSAFPYTTAEPEGNCPFRGDKTCDKDCALYCPNTSFPNQAGICAIRKIAESKK